MKKWGIIMVVVLIVGGLYFIELSKLDSDNETSRAMPDLDDLQSDETGRMWDHFYKVRAQIVDGQHATFSFPDELLALVGNEMELEGAAVFFSPGCRETDGKIAVHSFFLYPSLGLANACVHLPEVAMRWTIRIHLKNDWIVSRTDMIDAVVRVRGIFHINTKKPYESVFFLDNARVQIVPEKEVPF